MIEIATSLYNVDLNCNLQSRNLGHHDNIND